ncbi:unnamed protein product [marine sediment metagenome]|uniref:Uncharacterized protein n=1 Tax=marine sediment metagenome TaxID=412755 RepID=X0ZLY6_9ZZZZ
MYILRAIVNRGWCPILITALAIIAVIYEWPITVVAPIAGIILVVGLVVTAIGAREKELAHASLRLKELAGYFNRRFMGSSSLSIFAIIDGLYNIEDPRLWTWVQACDLSQRIFNTWCSSFVSRLESDIRTRKFGVYIRTYLNELWLINSHYFELIEQFGEVAQKAEMVKGKAEEVKEKAAEVVEKVKETATEARKKAEAKFEEVKEQTK